MATNTQHLKLLKKNVATDGHETFNIETMLNENWDKIDSGVKAVDEKVKSIDLSAKADKTVVDALSAKITDHETRTGSAKDFSIIDKTITKTGWYRIASNQSNRAFAEFELTSKTPGFHTVVTFNASIMFEQNPTVLISNYNVYENNLITKVRIVKKTLSDPSYLDIYVNNPSNLSITLNVYARKNSQVIGWANESLVEATIPGGFSAKEFEINALNVVDVTGQNTSLDTKNVNGIPATTITQKITTAETNITTVTNKFTDYETRTGSARDFSIVNKAITTSGWYRIASNPGNRAFAEFELADATGGYHSSAIFNAGIMYGKNPSLSLIGHVLYGANPFPKVRILYKGVYDAVYIDVFITVPSSSTSRTSVYVRKNSHSDGWVNQNLIEATIPDGYTTQEYTINASNVVDVTGQNTSLDTKNVNGIPATTITQKITTAETAIKEINDTRMLKVLKTNKDSEGIFKTVTYKRKANNTTYCVSTLSGGETPLYTTRTEQYYNAAGTSVIATHVYSLSYDDDGNLISEV